MILLNFLAARRRVKHPARHPEMGVTLIEMMIVLVIIGIVAALVVPNVIGRPDEARVAVANADLRTIAASLEMYRLDNRSYPTASQGLGALTAMPSEPPLPPNWTAGGYLPNLPTDPWGNPYVYTTSGQGSPYALMSLGADGQPGGDGVDADLTHGAGFAANGAGG
jgi:general secretion pathway protein G